MGQPARLARLLFATCLDLGVALFISTDPQPHHFSSTGKVTVSICVMMIEKSLAIRILTKNIRYATNAPFKGEERWEVRRPGLIKELRFNTAHCGESFIVMQEVLQQQIEDIHAGLNKGDSWKYIGVGRDDGHKKGEFSPIFFRPAIWSLKHWDTVWLSKTPEKPSRSWDAGATRILTVGVFEHHATKRKVVAMTTHLDERGARSRLESAKIILEQIKKYAGSDSENMLPVFLAGDFNSEPHEEAYLEVTGDGSPMTDLQELVSQNRQYGDSNTFSGFTSDTRRKRIDFVFLSKGRSDMLKKVDGSVDGRHSWIAEAYAVLPNRFEDGVYNSDHQAVVGDVRLVP